MWSPRSAVVASRRAEHSFAFGATQVICFVGTRVQLSVYANQFQTGDEQSHLKVSLGLLAPYARQLLASIWLVSLILSIPNAQEIAAH